MLLSDIIRIGKPLIDSDMSLQERIQLLSDVGKEEAKNFYGNVFVVVLDGQGANLHYRTFQDEENGPVQLDAAIAMPITIPSGGNPLNAQGIYPIPCYPLYDKHIKQISDDKKTFKLVHDRLVKTVPYFDTDQEELAKKSKIIADCLVEEATKFVREEKQLGVLFILDCSLELFEPAQEQGYLEIKVHNSSAENHFMNPQKLTANIIEARFQEAKELGSEKNAISTISNMSSEEVVSAYNKSWLWLSPTWEAPRSIYWEKKEWTKGIRLNRKEYEAYFYGAQFLKQVQTPIRAGVLKEMFAPTFSVEAKQNMRPTSFETIFGIPYFLPLTNLEPTELYTKFQNLKTRYESKDAHPNDLQLEIISGLQSKIMRNVSDDYRITIIYYSGILNRGDIHLRAQIEDVVPSIAQKVQKIVQDIERRQLRYIAHLLHIPEEQTAYTHFKVKHLPTLLSNAYGPGYLWTSMEKVLHGRPIGIERVTKQATRRMTELANKRDFWNIRFELLFYHLFLAFYQMYYSEILHEGKGDTDVKEWKEMIDRYTNGILTEDDVNSTEKVGFIAGCLVQQFERSYRRKLGKSYLDTRVMRFGSKLTPEMVWKNGLIEMEGLSKRRDLGISDNYRKALAIILPAMIRLKKNNLLTKEKDEFMTMFWSGYLMLPKKEEKNGVDIQ
ncbi:hypothetical protein JOC94_002510 [Bacillus thermophilus]|uniref:Uncharacterized protein n=1 Tax=Siminovitchia thermophila TaxID=1245522 RepID=A0ABS2R787_9BACI|nr:hypothetical protein [Siminovitchia thermophila]MBM7715522.1 hypothetical protein [Siminovitchia thermophila]ONK21391.1 hypothetical protein BLX87_21195 [Bacillus sp. VT-16-64]